MPGVATWRRSKAADDSRARADRDDRDDADSVHPVREDDQQAYRPSSTSSSIPAPSQPYRVIVRCGFRVRRGKYGP